MARKKTRKKNVSLSIKRGEKSRKGGLTAKGRRKYNRATGSKLKAPVTAKQAKKSKKSAARRKSFCARMSGVKKRASAKTRNDPNSRVNKALRRWDC